MLLIAHRGDTGRYPENTIAAFESAFAKGADGIELDVHYDDGVLAVVHDFIHESTASLPRLETVLKAISGKGRIEIEVKHYSADIIVPLQSAIGQYPSMDVEITSSEIPLIPAIRKAFPHTLVGLILPDVLIQDWMSDEVVQRKITGWAQLLEVGIVHLPYRVVSTYGQKRLIHALHAMGCRAHVHIFKTPDQLTWITNCRAWGVDQCTIDDLSLLQTR